MGRGKGPSTGRCPDHYWRSLRKAISSQLALSLLRTSQSKDSDFQGKKVRVMKRWACVMVSYRYMSTSVELYRMAKNAIQLCEVTSIIGCCSA